MKYGIYMRKPNATVYMRHCEVRRNRKGLLTQYPISYESFEDAEFDGKLIAQLGYQVKIKEVK